jgi:hypothetical protein
MPTDKTRKCIWGEGVPQSQQQDSLGAGAVQALPGPSPTLLTPIAAYVIGTRTPAIQVGTLKPTREWPHKPCEVGDLSRTESLLSTLLD